MQKNININDLFKMLEIDLDFQRQFEGIATYEKAVIKLDKIKELVKKQRRVLSKKYHPDVCADGEEKMKEINNLIDTVMKMKVNIQSPQPVMYRYYTYNTYNSYATSSTSTGGW